MQTVPFRDHGDNLLGICAAIGEDFGFNPLWLRIALAVALLFNPVGVLGLYAVMGVAVFASRMLFPVRRAAAPAAAVVQPIRAETLPSDLRREESEVLALAA